MTLPPYPGQPEQPEQPGSTPPPPPYGGTPTPPAPPGPPAGPPGGTPPPPAPPGPPPGMPGGMPPAPPYQPYQQFGGPNDASQGWSGLAIASFVTSLTCCLGPLALILGIVAIFRTGAGKAKGRWMAVTGIVLGLLGSIAIVAVVATGIIFGDRLVVTPGNAKVGQCVTAEVSGDEVTMIDFGCSVEHNAQIYAIATVTEADLATRGGLDLCIAAFEPVFPGVELREDGGDFRATIQGEPITIGAASDSLDLDAGDPVACWLQADDDVLEADLVP